MGADIAERLQVFSLAVLRLVTSFPRDRAGRHVADQYVRAATGAGSNYDEARAAESRADFVHKLGIAAKEMRETAYWTSLVARAGWIDPRHAHRLVDESQQLAAILSASARTARSRAAEAKSR